MTDRTDTTVTSLYCANHPNIETTLRCNRCEKPICAKCARLTPTGYRCNECVRGQQKVFENAYWYDYPLAFLLAGILSFIGSLIVPRLGFFTIFLAPVAGTIIAEVIRRVVRRRRARLLFRLAIAGTILGAAPLFLLNLLPLFGALSQGGGGVFGLLPLVWQGLYIFMATSTMYYRLSGIRV
jgi:hypothetical protein